jgi:hypothetical protein
MTLAPLTKLGRAIRALALGLLDCGPLSFIVTKLEEHFTSLPGFAVASTRFFAC